MKGLYTLVGMKHWNAESMVRSLPTGEQLTLVREPTNAHDTNAVQVWARGVAVGYIGRGRAPGPKYKPGDENVALAAHLDAQGIKPTEAIPGLHMHARLVPGQPPKIEVDE